MSENIEYRFATDYYTEPIILTDINEIKEYIKDGKVKYHLEKINENAITKPFFDYDRYINMEISHEEFDDLCLSTNNENVNLIKDFFEIDNSKIAIAQRHGIVENNKYKISWRYYITDHKILCNELKPIAKYFKQELEFFDDGIYSSNRNISMLYGYKPKDNRQLKKYTVNFKNIHFLHQHYNKDSILVTINDFEDKLPYDIYLDYKNFEKNNRDKEINYKDNTISKEDFEILITHMDVSKSETYANWVKGMFAIINVCRANNWSKEFSNDMIHKFSSKCPEKYDSDKINQFIHKNFEDCKDEIGLGTLKSWMKLCNIELYNKVFSVIQKQIREKLYVPFSNGATHCNIAEILVLLQKNYIFTGQDRLYEKNRFNLYRKLDPDTQDSIFRQKIMKDVKNDFIKFADNLIIKFKTQLDDSNGNYKSKKDEYLLENDEEIKKEIKQELDSLKNNKKNCKDILVLYEKNKAKTIQNLENQNFADKCFYTYKDMILDTDAEIKFNSYKHLMGFNNGVYDFETMEFRLPTDDEYISFSTGYDYDEYLDYQEIEDFMFSTSYDRECAIYRIRRLAGLCIAGNKEQKAIFKLGLGSNGKSVEDNIIRTCFGEYCGPISLDYWTDRKKNAEGASPFLLNLKNIKIAITNEAEENEKIVSSKFKNITGNDQIAARQMYDKTINKFEPILTPILFLNNIPKMTDMDYATYRRMEIDYYPHKFYDELSNEYDDNNPFHHKCDKSLNEKFKTMGGNIFNLFVHYLKTYKKQPKLPKYLNDKTKEIKTELDEFQLWKNECLRKTDDDTVILLYDDIYISYIKHAQIDQYDKQLLTKKLNRADMPVIKKGRKKLKCILGYELIPESESEDEEY